MFAGICAAVIGLVGCAEPLPWPESPLYETPQTQTSNVPSGRQAAMEQIAGVYAHYDVVAYEDVSTRTPMRSFTISYGFTEFRIEDGELIQIDRFCFANQKLNQQRVSVAIDDRGVQAIQPRTQKVELRMVEGQWRIHRPASPTLLGITGDPALPLSTDPDDPRIVDSDRDGRPGVTVELTMGGIMTGELYITRREIYEYDLTLGADGNLFGTVTDSSEQFVIDADRRILRQQSNAVQWPDPGLSPIFLVRVDQDMTCEELRERAADLFPDEPEF